MSQMNTDYQAFQKSTTCSKNDQSIDKRVVLSEYPTNTLKKVYVNVDSIGRKYVENAITTIKIDLFEKEKLKQTPCRQLT